MQVLLTNIPLNYTVSKITAMLMKTGFYYAEEFLEFADKTVNDAKNRPTSDFISGI